MALLHQNTADDHASSVMSAGYSEQRRLKVNATDIQTSEVFTGSGLDDLTPAGTFSGVRGIIYKIVISLAAGTDKYDWYKDGVVQASAVAMTPGADTLDLGVTATFAAQTGHTLGDFWEFEATITTDRHVVSDAAVKNLRISLDQKVWYAWTAATSEPAAATTTPTATADGDMVQSQILPAGNGITMAVPWGLAPQAGTASAKADLYLFIEKHTSDALMQIAEL